MAVTPSDLAEAIQTLFGISPELGVEIEDESDDIDVGEDFVAYVLNGKHYSAKVMFSIHDTDEYDTACEQRLEIWIWCYDESGEPIDVSNRLTYDEAMVPCGYLQNHVDWSVIMPVKGDDADTSIDIVLQRTVDIDDDDLMLIATGDHTSGVVRAIARTHHEWSVVAPAVAGIASGAITDYGQIKHFLGPHEDDVRKTSLT